MRKLVLAVTAASAAVLTACGGSSGGSTASTSVHEPATINVGDTSNGKTVDAHVGDTVTVTLHSTYWSLAEPSGSALQQSSAPSSSAGGSGCPHIPGSGCGTVAATYRADAQGTATLTAHRDSCGEALRCAPGQADWKVTVRVS
jgi:hypothetical protein